MQHGFSQRRQLRASHATPHHGHQERRDLIIRNVLVRSARNQKFDLFAGQFPAVSFLADEVNCAHSEVKAKLASRYIGVNEGPHERGYNLALCRSMSATVACISA